MKTLLSGAALAATCLVCSACGADERQNRATVTVKLPPARPYTPEPSFSFGKQSSELPIDNQLG